MLTRQEWDAMTEDEQKSREAEMPYEVRAEKDKAERERLVGLNIEKDRKLKASNQQLEDLNARIKALESSGGPRGEIKNLEDIRKQYADDLEKDPMMANARLMQTLLQTARSKDREAEQVKKTALRKLRKDFPKDYEKHGEELEEILDKVQDSSSITADSVLIMFNSLRGTNIDTQIKEAEARGAKKALEEAGIIAMDGGGSSDGQPPVASTLTKAQQEEMTTMGLSEKDYKEILRDRQESDKLEGKTPRTLISKPIK